MEEYQRTDEINKLVHPSQRQATPWAVLVALLILAAAGALGMYSYQQRSAIGQIAGREADLNANIIQLQGQLQDATRKINDIADAQVAHATAATNTARSNASAASVSREQASRLQQLQEVVKDQQKQLLATRDQVTKTRSDLEGNLNSTRNELDGSIARTHDELVVLQKRGERDYFEFDAAKSKQFQRSGPLNISVRRTDTKHGTVDLVILVNDREISKKGVNLYEPVWIYEIKDAQPEQVVVNRIDKNWAHGYVSAPKYSSAALSATTESVAPPTSTGSVAPSVAQPSPTVAGATR